MQVSFSKLVGNLMREVFEAQLEDSKKYRVVLTSAKINGGRSYLGTFAANETGPAATYVVGELAETYSRADALQIAFDLCRSFNLWGRVDIEQV